MNNHRQLCIAWRMYTEDNNDQLLFSSGTSVAMWRCPADKAYVMVGGERKLRVRSMNMNVYLGGFKGNPSNILPMGGQIIYRKYSQLSKPGADRIYMFIDVRPDANSWANFYVDMAGYSPYNPNLYMLYDVPASYHGNAGGLSFADGHSEIHRWRDVRTMPPIAEQGYVFNGKFGVPSQGNKDVGWLQDHSTRSTQ